MVLYTACLNECAKYDFDMTFLIYFILVNQHNVESERLKPVYFPFHEKLFSCFYLASLSVKLEIGFPPN